MDRMRYFALLMRMIVKDATHNRSAFWLFAVMMFLNNIVYFTLWAIYFHNFSSLRGWTLQDFAVLQGLCCSGFGLVFFVCGGAWNIARRIAAGDLDAYLGRPRAPLPALLMSESRTSALGDVASGPVFWLFFAGYDWSAMPLLLLLSAAAGILFLAVMILIQSVAFIVKDLGHATDGFFEMFMTVAIYPQKVYGFGVKILLFTLIPAAYIGFLPVEIMRDFSWIMVVAVLGAAGFYLWLAVAVFNRGLRLYSSGNGLRQG